MVYPVLTADPTDAHDLANNLIHCIYLDSVKPDMYYFLQKAYSGKHGQWESPKMNTTKC